MLIDMKLSPKDKKEEMNERTAGPDAMPDYPYGLTLNIDQDELDKLGISECEVGDELNISAVGKVTMCRHSAVEGRDPEGSMTIQITQLEVKDADEMAEAVESNGTKVNTPLTNAMR